MSLPRPNRKKFVAIQNQSSSVPQRNTKSTSQEERVAAPTSTPVKSLRSTPSTPSSAQKETATNGAERKVPTARTSNAVTPSRMALRSSSIPPANPPTPPTPQSRNTVINSKPTTKSPSPAKAKSDVNATNTLKKTPPPRPAWGMGSPAPPTKARRVTSVPAKSSSIPVPSASSSRAATPRKEITQLPTAMGRTSIATTVTAVLSPASVKKARIPGTTQSRQLVPKDENIPVTRPTSRIPTATRSVAKSPASPKVVRKVSVRAKVRPLSTSNRPAKLDLSKGKKQTVEQPDPNAKSPSTSPSQPEKSTPLNTSPMQSPAIRIEEVLHELRDTKSLSQSSSPTASFRSAVSSPWSSPAKTNGTVRTSEEVSPRQSRQLLFPDPPSRRDSGGTIFDVNSPIPSPHPSIPSPTTTSMPDIQKLQVPEPSRSPSRAGSNPPSGSQSPDSTSGRKSRRLSVSKLISDLAAATSATKVIKKKRPSTGSHLSTLSALELSLGTIACDAITTSRTGHVRKSSRGSNLVIVPSPEVVEKETKRMRKRYKIIREIIETEDTFLQDMIALEDGYNAFCHECSAISSHNKQTIFGRTGNVVGFSTVFYKELVQSTLDYMNRSEEDINSASYDAFVEWDKAISIGDVFLISMVRIEKAYTGYCVHQEEASQALQELEKNEKVKSWLEECKRRSVEKTKAWDIHSLLIKPVQRVLKYPLLLQELLHVTPNSYDDFTALELATKEITKVAERINESKRRKEICDRVLAKGRKTVSNINEDLAKSFGRRTDKLRSSFGLGRDWHDDTSELYGDLVSKFAKQALQVQVLARDLDRWIKDYRSYLNGADALVGALKWWLIFENPNRERQSKTWDAYFAHIEKVSSQIFPYLEHQIVLKCIQPLEKLYEAFKCPAALIAKHNRKAVDFARYTAMKAKDETPDKRLGESAMTFQSLHESLLHELPIFISLVCELVEAVVHQFTIAQAAWYQAWMEELSKLATDPFLAERNTTDAFVSIVANFLEHFESQQDIVESFAIINGSAIAHASRNPSLTALAFEEHERLGGNRYSGSISPTQSAISSRRPSKADSIEPPSSATTGQTSFSPEQRQRMGSLGSFDEEAGLSAQSPHRSLFRAFSVARYSGNRQRIDGFPYLIFTIGQEFDVVFEKDDRWLARVLGTDEVGWIPKSHCIQILV